MDAMKVKSIFRKITTVLGYTVLAAMMITFVFVLATEMSGKIAFIAGRSVVWVKTDSMRPTIDERSFILVKRVTPAEVEVGDVIVFVSDDPELAGAYNTHRVVEIIGDKDEFVTRGDNPRITENDSYTAKADKIAAVYVKNLPFLSRIGRFLYTKVGIVLTVALMLSITILMYLPDIKRKNRELSEEIEKMRSEKIDALVKAEVEKLMREHAQGPDGQTGSETDSTETGDQSE